MFEDFKENFLNMVSSRVFVLILVMITIATLIIQRLFDLQIVKGEETEERSRKTDHCR